MDELINGVWVVYGLEIRAYPLFISRDELTALRFVEKLGYYAYVKFWKFDTEWSIYNDQ